MLGDHNAPLWPQHAKPGLALASLVDLGPRLAMRTGSYVDLGLLYTGSFVKRAF